MMKNYLICPNCDSDDVMKNDVTRQGKQDHKCHVHLRRSPMWSPIY